MQNKRELRNILLFILGASMSQLGTVIYSFAIGLYILDTTGSGLKFATTLVVAFLPTLIITPFAGVFADWMDKKKIVIGADLVNGIVFIGLYCIILFQPLNLLTVYAVTFLTNFFTSFFTIAIDSVKPQLVSPKKLQSLNSISYIILASSGILGPLLGGLVYALIDIEVFIMINGISFICSAISEVFIDFEFNKGLIEDDNHEIDKNSRDINGLFRGVLIAMKEGLVYVMNKPELLKYVFIFLGINIAMSIGVQVPLPYILNNHLEIGTRAYGVINGIFPVGMICGALLVGKVTGKINYNKLLIGISFLIAVLIILMGIPMFLKRLEINQGGVIIYYSLIMGGLGFMISLCDVPIMTIIQSQVEEAYRGRAMGILIPMIKVINPIGYLVSGAMISIINPFYVPLGTGFIFGIFILLNRKILDKGIEIRKASLPIT